MPALGNHSRVLLQQVAPLSLALNHGRIAPIVKSLPCEKPKHLLWLLDILPAMTFILGLIVAIARSEKAKLINEKSYPHC